MTSENDDGGESDPSGTKLRMITGGDASFYRELSMRKDGGIEATVDNLVKILSGDQIWRGVLTWDQFRERITTVRDTPFRKHANCWSDADDLETLCWLERHAHYKYRGSLDLVVRSIDLVAHQQACHPVRDYLRSLTWDGVDRLSSWLSDVFGVIRNDYSSNIGLIWMVSAVSRVMDPGCQADYILVLEGQQGWYKSTAVQILAVNPDWYTDDIGEYGSKESKENIAGRWIIEEGELASLRRTERDAVKRFISCRSDKYRSAYGRRVQDHPRQCVVIGTVNPGAEGYLQDDTGARRFWPVALTGPADLAALRSMRDQLWAEATARYSNGERGCPDAGLIELASVEQEERRSHDSWEDSISQWLVGKSETTIEDVLANHLRIDPGKHDRASQMRVGNCLKLLGWRRQRSRKNGIRVYVWNRSQLELDV